MGVGVLGALQMAHSIVKQDHPVSIQSMQPLQLLGHDFHDAWHSTDRCSEMLCKCPCRGVCLHTVVGYLRCTLTMKYRGMPNLSLAVLLPAVLTLSLLAFETSNLGRQAWGLPGVCRAQGCMRASLVCAAGSGNLNWNLSLNSNKNLSLKHSRVADY